MCSPFWPTEAIHSTEYGQLVVTFVDATPESDWEMTTLQVADKNRVSSLIFQSRLFVTLTSGSDNNTEVALSLPFPELRSLPKGDPVPLPLLAKRGLSTN